MFVLSTILMSCPLNAIQQPSCQRKKRSGLKYSKAGRRRVRSFPRGSLSVLSMWHIIFIINFFSLTSIALYPTIPSSHAIITPPPFYSWSINFPSRVLLSRSRSRPPQPYHQSNGLLHLYCFTTTLTIITNGIFYVSHPYKQFIFPLTTSYSHHYHHQIPCCVSPPYN